MRPHLLRFAGIGPYCDEVEINFDDLGELGLYLIVGPTGAGKTTIFDAITFALYGKVAGGRETNGLGSDHSHRASPFVEFDFSHRGRSYRVHRVPAIDGKPAKPSDIRFTVFDDDWSTPSRSETGTTAVSKAVTDLVGLEADQFMKVMLLPQNEFQKFLLASSTDKEPLLRALFGTDLYERIARQMVESAKDLKKAADEKGNELSLLRGLIRDAADVLVTDGVVDDLPDADTDLPALVHLLASLVTEAEGEHDARKADAQAADEHRNIAEGEAERFAADEELATLRHKSQEAAPAEAEARSRTVHDDRARRVCTALADRDEAAGAVEALTGDVTAARADLVESLRRPSGTVLVLVPLRDASTTAAPTQLRHELATATAKLATAKKDFAEAEAACEQSTELTQTAARLEEDAAAADADIADRSSTLDGEQKSLVAAKTEAKAFPALDRKLRELDHLLPQADVAAAQRVLASTQKTFDAAHETKRRAEDALASARAARTLHLAGELAGALVEGEPCPVCGSDSHPSPATGGPETSIGELETERDSTAGKLTAAEHDLELEQERVAAAQVAAARLPTDEEQRALRAAHSSAEAAVEQVEALEESVRSIGESLTQLRKLSGEARKEAEGHRRRAADMTARCQTLRAGVAMVIEPALIDEVGEVLEGCAGCIDDLDRATKDLLAAVGAHTKTRDTAKAALGRETFDSEEAAREAVLPDVDRRRMLELMDEVAVRQRRMLVLSGTVGDKPVPTECPDVDALREAADATRRLEQAAGRTATTLVNAHKSVTKNQKKLAELDPDVDRLVRRAERARYIANVVLRGAHPMLGLERWVQRTVFEEVCDLASDQLRSLSHGRYVLTLDSDGQRSRTRSGGLDLYVMDGHTGCTRGVASLSGGEKFLTSLALALALAEVVQNRSGGIELSTLFIDEGFGSLDADTLETAVEVLRTLQDTGRTVGVISHVEAMRQELPVGIQVTPGVRGSTLSIGPAVTSEAA